MRAVLICVVASCCLAMLAQAADADTLMAVWFTSHACKTKLEVGKPGSSRENPIVVTYFSQLKDDAARAKDQPEGKPAKQSEYDCKWVELTGFFTWLEYYHYRGNLYASAWDRYGSAETKYVIERFADKSVRRGGLSHRRLTLIGRFYDLCAAADRAEREANENWGMIFGPCHYGANNGMMLTDVSVKRVFDEKPRYLLGENNRDLIGDFPLVEAEDVLPLERLTREWAMAIKRGPAVYANETIARNPAWKKESKAEREEAKRDLADADGYAAHLYANEAFRQMDPQTSQVKVFWEGKDQATSKKAAWGCICLRADCAERWPITRWDAYRFLGDAACMEFDRPDQSSAWRWE